MEKHDFQTPEQGEKQDKGFISRLNERFNITGNLSSKRDVFILAGVMSIGLTQPAGESDTFSAEDLSGPISESSDVQHENQAGTVIEIGTNQYTEIAERLGMSPETLDNKFVITLQVEHSENGPFIIHIGQKHRVEKDTTEDRATVVEVQKDVEEVLLSLNKTGVQTVHAEGVSDFEPGSPLYFLKGVTEQIEATQLSDDGLKEFLTLFLGNYKNAQDNTYTEGLKYLEYLFSKKVSQIDEAVARGDISTATENYTLYKQLESYVQGEQSGDDNTPYYMGAAVKLYLEKVISLAITDIPNAERQQRRAILDDVNAKRAEYINARAQLESGNSSYSRQQVQELEDAYRDARRAFDKLSENREDAVLSNISNNHSSDGGETVPLVFGAWHNFSNNVRAHNEQNDPAETDFGLIKLSPKVLSE